MDTLYLNQLAEHGFKRTKQLCLDRESGKFIVGVHGLQDYLDDLSDADLVSLLNGIADAPEFPEPHSDAEAALQDGVLVMLGIIGLESNDGGASEADLDKYINSFVAALTLEKMRRDGLMHQDGKQFLLDGTTATFMLTAKGRQIRDQL